MWSLRPGGQHAPAPRVRGVPDRRRRCSRLRGHTGLATIWVQILKAVLLLVAGAAVTIGVFFGMGAVIGFGMRAVIGFGARALLPAEAGPVVGKSGSPGVLAREVPWRRAGQLWRRSVHRVRVRGGVRDHPRCGRRRDRRDRDHAADGAELHRGVPGRAGVGGSRRGQLPRPAPGSDLASVHHTGAIAGIVAGLLISVECIVLGRRCGPAAPYPIEYPTLLAIPVGFLAAGLARCCPRSAAPSGRSTSCRSAHSPGLNQSRRLSPISAPEWVLARRIPLSRRPEEEWCCARSTSPPCRNSWRTTPT